VPNTPEASAIALAEALGIPFAPVFYKKKGESRAFMAEDKDTRAIAINTNLFVLDKIYDLHGNRIRLEGKRVYVVEDSIVRGNNAPDAAAKLRKEGVKWVGMGVMTPPIGGPGPDGIKRGCYSGVDMPSNDRFAIVECGSIEGVKEHAGLDALNYLSEDGMVRAIGLPAERLCRYCIGGPFPGEGRPAPEL